MARPKKNINERKVACNISLSKKSVTEIDRLSISMGYKTRSALIEAIGQKQIHLQPFDPSTLARIPIYQRINSISSEPVAVFWSITSFTERIFSQFGLYPHEDRVLRILLQANTILFYIGFLMPDINICNSSSLLRYLIFHIVQSASLQKSPDLENRNTISLHIDENVINKHLSIIGNALLKLERKKDPSIEYQILKMKSLNGMTFKQVARVFNSKNITLDKIDVARYLKTGLAKFRSEFYPDKNNHISDQVDESVIARLYQEKEKIFDSILCYNKIVIKPYGSLRQNVIAQRELQAILMNTNNQPYLDFWLNEIDYFHGNLNENIRKRFRESFHGTLLVQKEYIERQLQSCQCINDIRELLEREASYEAGIHLDAKILLGEFDYLSSN